MVKTRRRRVHFAPGPLADLYATKDGHPQHEGQTAIQRRSVPSQWPIDLTSHSIRMLEAEVGDICQHSIERLKRRVGLLPPIQRPLEYLTAAKSFSPATDMLHLQPVMSRARSSQQANKQPSQGANSQSSARAMSRNAAAAAVLTAGAGSARAAEAQLASTPVEQPKDQTNSDQQIRRTPQIDFNLSKSGSHGPHNMTLQQLDKTSHKSSKSPKRSLVVHVTASRQSARNKALRIDN
ncbi:TPA: hypothetical protein ACH3X1_008371 [Trebouxia sp. C0004]